jgi:hypothetical protein
MAAPAVSPGLVEQAIFTWSKHNLGGGRGLGIGEVSPGLRTHVSWLGSLDLNSLRPFDETLDSEADGYKGWEELSAVGAFPAGKLTVVYRKIASAGFDGAGRNRFLVHLLIGRSGDFDLGSIADDDPHWLRAEQCPLNRLPKLRTLRVTELRSRAAAHDCSALDRDARTLLEQLIREPNGLTCAAGSSPPATRLLAAVPTALWGQIRLGWWVGREGPVARVGPIGATAATAKVTADRTSRAGLDDCAFHSRVDEVWAGIPAAERSWPAFARVFGATDLRAGGSRSQASLKKEEMEHEAVADSRRRASAAIAAAIGASHWDGWRTLADWEAQRALAALERVPSPPDGWLSVFSGWELRALFAGIESNPGFARALRFLEHADAPTETLLARWRETGLAALGLAVLGRDVDPEPAGTWAVPKHVDPVELGKLVGYLRRSERGLDRLALLLTGGFAWSTEGRRSIISALLAVGATPREVFGIVLERAELPPRSQLDFIRENADLAGEWLGVPEKWLEAFRLGFAPRRRFPFPFLRHPSRVFDQ